MEYELKFRETISATKTTPNIVALRDRNATTIQVNLAGTLVVNLAVQYSVDGINFKTITGKTTTGSTPAAPEMFDMAGISPRFYRVVFTVTGGSGQVEVWMN